MVATITLDDIDWRAPHARRRFSFLMGTPRRAGPPMDYRHKPPPRVLSSSAARQASTASSSRAARAVPVPCSPSLKSTPPRLFCAQSSGTRSHDLSSSAARYAATASPRRAVPRLSFLLERAFELAARFLLERAFELAARFLLERAFELAARFLLERAFELAARFLLERAFELAARFLLERASARMMAELSVVADCFYLIQSKTRV
jgi:hypothetical protein